MEKSEVSRHQLSVYLFVNGTKGWVTNYDTARGANVAFRTARLHSKMLVDLGIFDHAEVFPGHRFKLAVQAEKRNKPFWLPLQVATEVFGLAG
jgi:hypothetical protein